MIGFTVRDASNTPRTITGWLIRDAANVQQTVTAGYDRATGNASELFYNPAGDLTLSVSLNADFVAGFSAGTGNATTTEAIATASGGTAPYTYAWTLTAVPDNPTVANFPTLATTDFTMSSMPPANTYVTFWQITVTDALSNTATAPIQAIFSDTSGPF